MLDDTGGQYGNMPALGLWMSHSSLILDPHCTLVALCRTCDTSHLANQLQYQCQRAKMDWFPWSASLAAPSKCPVLRRMIIFDPSPQSAKCFNSTRITWRIMAWLIPGYPIVITGWWRDYDVTMVMNHSWGWSTLPPLPLPPPQSPQSAKL